MSKHIIDLKEYSNRRDIEDLTDKALTDSIVEEIGKNKKVNKKLTMLLEEAKKRKIQPMATFKNKIN